MKSLPLNGILSDTQRLDDLTIEKKFTAKKVGGGWREISEFSWFKQKKAVGLWDRTREGSETWSRRLKQQKVVWSGGWAFPNDDLLTGVELWWKLRR